MAEHLRSITTDHVIRLIGAQLQAGLDPVSLERSRQKRPSSNLVDELVPHWSVPPAWHESRRVVFLYETIESACEHMEEDAKACRILLGLSTGSRHHTLNDRRTWVCAIDDGRYGPAPDNLRHGAEKRWLIPGVAFWMLQELLASDVWEEGGRQMRLVGVG